ncbi:hypothetical protein ACNKU7_06910 [Microbulbifer sp. SA54]|uniref:hypothetical protein n=1 Tax=Microbulbifer sp. SA54 TaxID=3401577 RepID=UPI003AAF66AE
MKNAFWTLTANVKAEGAKSQGVILAVGGVAVGLVLYLDKGVPVFDYNFFEEHTTLKGSKAVSGDATIEVDFDYQGDKPGGAAKLTLKVNGESVATGELKQTIAGRFGIDTFGIGEDTGQPVTHEYEPPNAFTGEIEKVVVEMK